MQEAVSQWFTQVLGLRCWLVQQQAGSRRALDREQPAAGVPSLAPSSPPASSEAALEPLNALQSRSIGVCTYHQTPVCWRGLAVLTRNAQAACFYIPDRSSHLANSIRAPKAMTSSSTKDTKLE